MRSHEAGFTLIELVIAAGLIALMASLAGMSIPPAIARSRVQHASTMLADALRKAQISAVREARMWRVTFDTDGRGFSEEYASTPTAPTDCSSPGWQQDKHTAFPAEVIVTGRSRGCITFSTSGRTQIPVPQVDHNQTTLPFNGGPSRMRLTDGYRVGDQQVNDWTFSPVDPNSPTAKWNDASVSMVIDGLESRYYQSLCIGMVSVPDFQIGYPAWIIVEAAPASGSWSNVYEGAGPADPGVRAQTCLPVPLGQELRYFRVTMTANSPNEIALDEIDLGDLFITLTGRGSSRQVLVSPVTGRVRVKSN